MPDILITGSKGFIGTALIKRLAIGKETYHILEFDLAQGDVAQVMPAYPHVDHVVHLAGKTFVPQSWEQPQEFYRSNVQGTANILEYCRKTGAGLTYLSAYVYGQPDYLPIDEKHPLKPNNPYMHSKVLAEDLCQFYASHFAMNITILRPFNVFGNGQDPRFLIPELVQKIMDPSDKTVWIKDLRPKRDFIFIDDLVNAIVLAMEQGNGLNIYNVGSGKSYSVSEIASLIMEITNIHKDLKSQEEIRKNEIMDVRADIRKIQKTLNWSPNISLKEGLEKYIL
jgi:nucleoside-diphosphate-sugar epimerase